MSLDTLDHRAPSLFKQQASRTSQLALYSALALFLMVADARFKITTPVRGATLIGDGATALTKIEMIGDDFAFDPGVGTCGKAGQGVPVGIGQPSLKIGGLTVGGTAV